MFEHVIRIPFDMRPVFKPCERPSYNKIILMFIFNHKEELS